MSAFVPTVPLTTASLITRRKGRRCCISASVETVSRRTLLSTALAAVLSARLHAVGVAPLAESLAGVVRIRDALEELSSGDADAIAGARDLRRTLSTLLLGSALRNDAAAAAQMLPSRNVALEVTKHVDAAREYIDLATGYFDERAGALTGEERAFAMQALSVAQKELDEALAPFGDEALTQARALLQGAVL